MVNKILFKIVIIFSVILSALFANNNEKIKTTQDIDINNSLPAKRDKIKFEDIDSSISNGKYDDIINTVFKDVAKITPDGKQMILIFGANLDPYSDKLKADIASSDEIQKRFKNEFSSYYFNAYLNLRHKQLHEGEFIDVDTNTMIDVYGIKATPTIIFTDKLGKAVIIVPGYMPIKQFLVTMDFMRQGKWKGKNRKNGEVYEALKDFYIFNSIEVKQKKDNS